MCPAGNEMREGGGHWTVGRDSTLPAYGYEYTHIHRHTHTISHTVIHTHTHCHAHTQTHTLIHMHMETLSYTLTHAHACKHGALRTCKGLTVSMSSSEDEHRASQNSQQTWLSMHVRVKVRIQPEVETWLAGYRG